MILAGVDANGSGGITRQDGPHSEPRSTARLAEAKQALGEPPSDVKVMHPVTEILHTRPHPLRSLPPA